jgi:N-acetylglutamate synthase-like GNAT family acetyltransferase
LAQGLLTPLEKAGVLVKRSTEDLLALIHNFTVLERETKVWPFMERDMAINWC